MKRKMFDFPGYVLDKNGAWVRVRDEGDKITLSYKRWHTNTLHGTEDITVEVSDFENTCNILLACGFILKSYQETKREKWELEGTEMTIDAWPWIPPFIEIEGPNEESVRNASFLLGFEWSQALYGGVTPVYQKYFDVTDDEINTQEIITFELTPEWLEMRRKK